MKWLTRLLDPSAYDQGHQDGYQEGYKEGQDWGHDHGACEHTHPFEEARRAGLYNRPSLAQRGDR